MRDGHRLLLVNTILKTAIKNLGAIFFPSIASIALDKDMVALSNIFYFFPPAALVYRFPTAKQKSSPFIRKIYKVSIKEESLCVTVEIIPALKTVRWIPQ